MTKDILSVADAPGMSQMGEPSLQDNQMVCPEGTSKVQKEQKWAKPLRLI